MKIVMDVSVQELPIFFQECQEIGLTGEGVYYFLTSLDFHGQTDPNYNAQSSRLKTNRISEEELRELIFNDISDSENATSTFR